MELDQVNWDEQKKLIFEFKKDNSEKSEYLPDTVRSLNLQFNISKTFKNENYYGEMPFLVSIKELYFSYDALAFSIELDEPCDPDDLEINIECLTIFLHSGPKKRISINKKFQMSEISLTDDYGIDLNNYSLNPVKDISKAFKQEIIYDKNNIKSNKIKKKIPKIHYKEYDDQDFPKPPPKFPYGIEENLNIVNTSLEKDSINFMIKDGYERLKKVENQLKEVNIALKKLSLRTMSAPPTGESSKGIERIKRESVINSPLRPPEGMFFLRELKTLVHNKDAFKNYLKPMCEEELNKIILDDNVLIEKQKELFERKKTIIKKVQA